jgi:membrane protein YdbS with pleckstrin-like domain
MAAQATTPLTAGAIRTDGAPERSLQRLPVTLRPHASLLKYYLLSALLFGPFFIFALPPFYFRFRTLRYDVDEEGITVRWGVLFRREVSLTYARIQDIQLTSNIAERWLGLARIQLQTASGSASAEMTIEGIRDVDGMRDFLYSRMRGASYPSAQRQAVLHGDASAAGAAAGSASGAAGTAGVATPVHDTLDSGDVAELTAALDAVAAELRAVRLALTDADPRGRRD